MTTDVQDGVLIIVVALSSVILLANAVVLAGALIAAIRSDHRNPASRRALDWYEHRPHRLPRIN